MEGNVNLSLNDYTSLVFENKKLLDDNGRLHEKINDLRESLKKLSDSKDNAIVVHHNVWNDDYICEIEVDLDKYKDWCDNSMVKKVESLEKENKELKMQVCMLHEEINHLENRNLFERIFNK